MNYKQSETTIHAKKQELTPSMWRGMCLWTNMGRNVESRRGEHENTPNDPEPTNT